MYCPQCGKPLEEVPGHTEDDVRNDRGFLDEETGTLHERTDESIWLWCPRNGCFGKDFPLRYHHPFKGWSSQPGDSWSLSWIK